jgi:transketolase
MACLEETILKAQANKGSGVPTMILMKTEMGYGVDYMMGSHKWHGTAPNDAELASALGQLETTLGDY